jgi:hypothetical protein
MSAFDTARDIRLPGVVIERVYIDPKLLTTRMKNAVKKMLREGRAHGSWSSKSKALAMKLAECNDVMVVGSTGWGFSAPPRHTYGDDTIAEVLALIDADEALELIDDAQHYPAPHLHNVQKRTRDKHERNREIIRIATPHRWMGRGHSKEIMFQMIDVFTKTRSQHLIERAEKVCAMLDNNEPIEISISH